MWGVGTLNPWYGTLLNETQVHPGKALKGGGNSFWKGVDNLDQIKGYNLYLSRVTQVEKFQILPMAIW